MNRWWVASESVLLLLLSCWVGCGGSSAYQTAAGDGDTPSSSAAGGAADAAPPSAEPLTAADFQSGAAGAQPASSPSGIQPPPPRDPSWDSRELPEVVPYAEPEEPEEAPRGPVDNFLPSNFTSPPPNAAEPGAGASSASTAAAAGYGVPSGSPPSSSSAPPYVSPPADGTTPSGPPAVPRGNNPYGFPNGTNPAGPAMAAPQGLQAAGEPGAVSLRLHRGVALAQTLPTGTAMGFQVQYVFNSDFNPNARYAWIIKPPQGQAVAMEVKLDKSQGALSTFVTQWGPVTGGYEMQIQMMNSSGRPQPICKPITAYYAR